MESFLIFMSCMTSLSTSNKWRYLFLYVNYARCVKCFISVESGLSDLLAIV